MKELKLTCDIPTWVKVWEIEQELKSFEKILISKYNDLSFDLWICFRCLTENSGWISKARFHKIDNALSFDIIMIETDFDKIKKDKEAQRKIMGKAFYPFFKETLEKYQKKLPGLKERKDDLLLHLRQWLIENRWIAENDYI